MPFQSEKQRKYLWANEPAIAKRWEKYPKGYNTGGVSHLFRSKYDAGDYNSGGYVRPEEDGVLGLADGGRIGFNAGSMLVAPTTDGSRPGYAYDDYEDMGFGDGADMGSPSNSDDHGAGDPDQFDMSSNDGPHRGDVSGPAPTVTDHGDPMGNPDEQAKYARYVKYTLKDQVKKEDSELVKFLKFMGKTAAVVGTGGTALGFGNLGVVKLATAVDKAYKLSNTFVTGYNLFNKTDYTKTELWNKIQEEAKLAKELEKKSAGLGGEEFQRRTYADQLKLLQFRDKDEQDGDGDKTTTTEDVRRYPTKEEMMAAAQRAYEMLYGDRRSAQIPEDTSKRDAYLAAYKQKYLMGAKGGRVPGYNTGGLSSLFRLKNK